MFPFPSSDSRFFVFRFLNLHFFPSSDSWTFACFQPYPEIRSFLSNNLQDSITLPPLPFTNTINNSSILFTALLLLLLLLDKSLIYNYTGINYQFWFKMLRLRVPLLFLNSCCFISFSQENSIHFLFYPLIIYKFIDLLFH